CDRLNAAMRMPRETGEIVARPVVAEVVEQQERVGFAGLAEAEGAAQFDAGALDGRLRLHDAFDGSDGHGESPFLIRLSHQRPRLSSPSGGRVITPPPACARARAGRRSR